MYYLSSLFKKKPNIVEKDIQNHNALPVAWIHGANQSSTSWNYVRDHCNFQNEILINYSSTNKFYENLKIMINDIGDQPVFLVGHSLGGIYALHLLKHCNVAGVVSISTPYRGSSAADWAKYIIPGYQLFKDVGRKSKPITEGHEIPISVPYTQIVSTTGSVPYVAQPNDGVVTIASMEHRKSEMSCIRVPATHYEVMVQDQVSEIIKSCYCEVSNISQETQ